MHVRRDLKESPLPAKKSLETSELSRLAILAILQTGVRIAGPFGSENYLARTSALGATSKVGRARIKSFRRRTAPKIMNPPKMASLPGSGTALIEKMAISGLEIGSLRAKRRNQITPFIPTAYRIEEAVREVGMEEEWKCGAWFFPSFSNQGLWGFAELRRRCPEWQQRQSEPRLFDQDLTILRPT